jgi:hypothetical protein
MLSEITTDPTIAARMGKILNWEAYEALAPRVMATEIEPGPTVNGKVSG